MIDEDLHTIPLLLVLPFKAEAKLDDAAVAAEARRREFVIKAKSKVKLKTGKPFENVSKRRHTKTILSLHNLKAVCGKGQFSSIHPCKSKNMVF